MSSRTRNDSATLISKDGSVSATLTLLESPDDLSPIIRIHIVGRDLEVAELWVGKGADGSDIDIDLTPLR